MGKKIVSLQNADRRTTARTPSHNWPACPPLRRTLFEIQEFVNNGFRRAYQEVADSAVSYAREHGLTHIVELGAGSAPVTRAIAERSDTHGLRLTACDLMPHVAEYEALERRFAGKVTAITSSVDYGQVRDWGPGTLLLLMGTFPAILPEARPRVLEALTRSSERVMVCEHVRRTPLSVFLSCWSLFPGLLLPVVSLHRPGRLRRFFWCWLFPVAPILYMLDGVYWCLHSWSDTRWRSELAKIVGSAREPTVKSWINSQTITW